MDNTKLIKINFVSNLDGQVTNIVVYGPYILYILNMLVGGNKSCEASYLTYNGCSCYEEIEYSDEMTIYTQFLQDDIREAFEHTPNVIKVYIKYLISLCKLRAKGNEKLLNNRENVILQYIHPNTFRNLSFQASLSLKDFKCFIVYLMKKYKLNKEKAFSFYKEGKKEKCFAFNLDRIYEGYHNTLEKCYDSKSKADLFERDVFKDFIEYQKSGKINNNIESML